MKFIITENKNDYIDINIKFSVETWRNLAEIMELIDEKIGKSIMSDSDFE